MKKIVIYLFVISCVSFTLLHSVLEKNNTWYQQQVVAITDLSSEFYEASKQDIKSQKEKEKLQKIFLEFRSSYKKAEFLIEYFDHDFVQLKINGAPLPKLMKKIPEITVIEPHGFQVIEEIIFSNEVDKQALVHHAAYMHQAFKELQKNHQSIKIYDRQVFEAARFQLIRIMSMGLTGFDTPCTDVSIQESCLSLKGTWTCLQQYKDGIHDKILKKQFAYAFETAIKYLEAHQDFEKFDRLEFIRNYLNPLYKSVAEVQEDLEIETVEEAGLAEYAITYNSKDLFGQDFLNDNYFVTTKGVDNLDTLELLGKYLFFDPALSANNERACASCHQPENGFTSKMAKNEGFNHEGELNRNTPTLLNVVYADRFFYDLRASKIEDQVQHVVFNDKEFNTSFVNIKSRMQSSKEYMELFKTSFPYLEEDMLVTKQSISKALSVYMLSLKSNNSDFDQYIRGETSEIEASVKNGFNLFMGKAACGTCHFAPTFNGTVPPYFSESETEVLGVPQANDTLNPVLDKDGGRGITGVLKERSHIYYNAFKTPTVRNIELTAPYMHNGAYHTLEDVMDFYNRGGGIGLGLEVPNQTLPPDPLQLSEKEKQDIIAFMQSLTDTVGLTSRPQKLPYIPSLEENSKKRVIGGLY